MIRTLIVDDSPTIRAFIRASLSTTSDILVVGEAAEPHQARAAIKALAPDVITLDVEMPGMNGLEFLERLMRLRPMPVVMVSNLTAQGTRAALHAMALGAIECVAKPTRGGSFDEVVDAVRVAAAARVRSMPGRRAAAEPEPFAGGNAVIAIGSSTGGVEALSSLLSTFPANCPPTLITQHIRSAFTKSLADRLDKLCAASVAEARHGEPLQPGRIYLAPGGAAHLTVAGARTWRCALVEGSPISGHCPSVDVLFESVARTVGARAIGVILTGMGKDGAQGLLSIRSRGGRTIGQSAESCVVYGMPRAAFEIGAIQTQIPLGSITAQTLAAAATLTLETH